jgi:hypothetical protein
MKSAGCASSDRQLERRALALALALASLSL